MAVDEMPVRHIAREARPIDQQDLQPLPGEEHRQWCTSTTSPHDNDIVHLAISLVGTTIFANHEARYQAGQQPGPDMSDTGSLRFALKRD